MNRIKRNIEVRVALLRNGLTVKDLGKIFGLSDYIIQHRLGYELSTSLQNKLIKLIECVASDRELTSEDAQNYLECREEIQKMQSEHQAWLDERTIAFVERIEKNENPDKKEIETMCEKFNITEEVER